MEADVILPIGDRNSNQLRCKVGQIVKVVRFLSPTECRAEIDGREGTVDRSSLSLRRCDWFAGTVSSEQIVALLLRQIVVGKFAYDDGMYFIRYSDFEKKFVLSLKAANTVVHFLISRANGAYYIWPDERFLSINSLVEHYQVKPIGGNSLTLRADDRRTQFFIVHLDSVAFLHDIQPHLACVDHRKDAVPVVKSTVLEEIGIPMPPLNSSRTVLMPNGREKQLYGPVQLHFVTADLRRFSGLYNVSLSNISPDIIITETMLINLYTHSGDDSTSST